MHSQRPPRSPCTPGDQGGRHALGATKDSCMGRSCHALGARFMHGALEATKDDQGSVHAWGTRGDQGSVHAWEEWGDRACVGRHGVPARSRACSRGCHRECMATSLVAGRTWRPRRPGSNRVGLVRSTWTVLEGFWGEDEPHAHATAHDGSDGENEENGGGGRLLLLGFERTGMASLMVVAVRRAGSWNDRNRGRSAATQGFPRHTLGRQFAMNDGPIARGDVATRKHHILKSSIEETVKDLDNKWENIQNKASKQPSPAQREKALDKQLHSLIEQLAAKQAQAEDLIGEIHSKVKELERLSGLRSKLESSNAEANAARNRFRRGSSDKGSSSDFSADYHPKLPYHTSGRSENQQRLMLLRSAFVLYILALHILVFIRISF
ncbi:protein YLS7-like [Hibiscus syriacus]|uniref:Protein YLS7-like n=1 Tax=Hibiscus syriacus TaxID=106335 RepID=A0A6A2ZR24_HIBSY|nr:protein YLS7-like [Hibiscus syriacus]